MRDARHERVLSLLYALAFAIFRRLVLALCWCLRRRSLPALVKLCHKRLLPKLPPFTADVRLRLAPSVTLRCFQLGGEHHADILSEWLLLSGTWQPNLSAWLRRTLHRGDTFVDVGANTGYFSLLAAALVHGEGGGVVAIEACPRTFRRLQTNLMRNAGLASCIRPLQLAAAEAEGSTTLFQHRREPLYSTTVAGAGAGGVAASADVWSIVQASGATRRDQTASASVAQLAQDSACWHQVTVRKAPLDELLSADECARARVVKVDVEGGEWTVLRGMARVLEIASPELEIVVEVTPKWLALQQVGRRGSSECHRVPPTVRLAERVTESVAPPAGDTGAGARVHGRARLPRVRASRGVPGRSRLLHYQARVRARSAAPSRGRRARDARASGYHLQPQGRGVLVATSRLGVRCGGKGASRR
jgi:FkbM family methyltransferase